MNKFCQGPKCHTYMTQDRKRGIKGDKYFQTRSVGRYGYGNGSTYTHYFINKLTTERIPLTEAQYDDNNYTIERIRG